MVGEIRLSLIDDSNRSDHYHLSDDDTCYFLFEYTSHRNYDFSATNNLISNLKKKPSQAAHLGFHYKARAINQCAQFLRTAINLEWLASATLVPVPGSKAVDHPDYDDRIIRICRSLTQPPPDVRSLVKQTQSTAASHEVHVGERISVEDLLELYEIDESLVDPEPQRIAIVDDVLTAGTHFRAMQNILSDRFPNAEIVGIFVARRVFPDDEIGLDGQ